MLFHTTSAASLQIDDLDMLLALLATNHSLLQSQFVRLNATAVGQAAKLEAANNAINNLLGNDTDLLAQIEALWTAAGHASTNITSLWVNVSETANNVAAFRAVLLNISADVDHLTTNVSAQALAHAELQESVNTSVMSLDDRVASLQAFSVALVSNDTRLQQQIHNLNRSVVSLSSAVHSLNDTALRHNESLSWIVDFATNNSDALTVLTSNTSELASTVAGLQDTTLQHGSLLNALLSNDLSLIHI